MGDAVGDSVGDNVVEFRFNIGVDVTNTTSTMNLGVSTGYRKY
jgi:hypothetical protein